MTKLPQMKIDELVCIHNFTKKKYLYAFEIRHVLWTWSRL